MLKLLSGVASAALILLTWPAHAAPTLVACHLENNAQGPWSSDGMCGFRPTGHGSFAIWTTVRGQGLVIAGVVVDQARQTADGLWGRDAKFIGRLYANGPCWENAIIRICAWKPGEAPVLPVNRLSGPYVAPAPVGSGLPAELRQNEPFFPPSPPSGSAGASQSVDIIIGEDHTMAVFARFGSAETTTAMIDTGASIVSIPQPIADALLRKGEAKPEGEAEFRMADGQTRTHKMIRIGEMRLGAVVFRNVLAAVAPDGAAVLIGSEALEQLGAMTIDRAARRITFAGR